ncbi:phage tail protein, partial [Salmonella enterica]|nr:phage tail protein [Salmonella enterica]
MFHLDNNSGISAMPKPAVQQSSATRWFTEGGGNNSPSWPGQDWFNIVQAELLNVLTTAGIAPEKTAFNQLALAIKAIINKDALLKDNLLSEIRTAGASSQKTARENLDITDATLNKKGLTQLSNAVDSTSEAQSATPKAVKIAMDNANARLAKDRNGADIPNKPLFLQNVGLRETINRAAGAMQKDQNGADIPDKKQFARTIGAVTSTSVTFGESGWFKIATVVMPQATSTAVIKLYGGAG